MGKITERRKMYAEKLTMLGVDLTKNYFSHPDSKVRIIREQADFFNFKKTSLTLTKAQQFYYAAVIGYQHIKKEGRLI